MIEGKALSWALPLAADRLIVSMIPSPGLAAANGDNMRFPMKKPPSG